MRTELLVIRRQIATPPDHPIGVHVDLVFSDVVMPKVDGVLLARKIGRRRPRLPIVLTTGRPDFVDWIVNRGGVALINSIERLRAVLSEQLSPQVPASTASQPPAIAKRTGRRKVNGQKIDLTNSTDVRYWCRRFRCTQSDLRAAVKLLGTDPASVEKPHGGPRPWQPRVLDRDHRVPSALIVHSRDD